MVLAFHGHPPTLGQYALMVVLLVLLILAVIKLIRQ
jgi:hypothetical protein